MVDWLAMQSLSLMYQAHPKCFALTWHWKEWDLVKEVVQISGEKFDDALSTKVEKCVTKAVVLKRQGCIMNAFMTITEKKALRGAIHPHAKALRSLLGKEKELELLGPILTEKIQNAVALTK
eukprot:5640446-Amphidinium_carterae.1